MKPKLAIAFCLHHKPWLGMSTLITLALQGYRDFDLYFLHQLGDGSCPDKDSYKQYHQLTKNSGKNPQLSPHDERIRQIASQVNFKNTFNLKFENDQGLDSGAFYKFIKTNKWKDYDFVLFLQEGTVFTRENVLSSALNFMQKNDIHFLSSGHEKRRLPKNLVMNSNTKEGMTSELDLYYRQELQEIIDIFCRDEDFKQLYNQWSSDIKVTTQNHVPDIPALSLERFLRIVGALKRRDWKAITGKTVYDNAYRRPLEDVVGDYTEHNKVIFHKDNNLEWFGCSCQHLLSRKFLEEFSKRIEKYNLFEALDVPYAAEILEIIWGFLPNWLGFDKWFFDGIHRVRKDFVTYQREDSPFGMCKYINRYFRNKINVVADGDFIRIEKINKKFNFIKDVLGQDYFANQKTGVFYG